MLCAAFLSVLEHKQSRRLQYPSREIKITFLRRSSDGRFLKFFLIWSPPLCMRTSCHRATARTSCSTPSSSISAKRSKPSTTFFQAWIYWRPMKMSLQATRFLYFSLKRRIKAGQKEGSVSLKSRSRRRPQGQPTWFWQSTSLSVQWKVDPNLFGEVNWNFLYQYGQVLY